MQIRRIDFLNNEEGYANLLCIKESVAKFLELNKSCLWSSFQLARMCVRYTYYDLAHEIYTSLATHMTNKIPNMCTSDLSYKCWFDFMAYVCRAEHLMSKSDCASINDLILSLNEALSSYMMAQVVFKSNCTRCLTPSTTALPVLETSATCFQIKYCELRCEQIRLYVHLLLSTMTCITIPAPIFQFKSSENFSRFCRISQQMKYSIVELQKLTQKYKDFLAECFDADMHTINILNM